MKLSNAAPVLLVATVLLAGCSFENKYEREADKITRAVMSNDLAPVQNDIAKGTNINRVKIAEWADELDAQGKLLSVKETQPCDPGAHCFIVKFEKHTYREELAMDDQGKVTHWTFRMADAP
ncbi:MAG TPA: hypothetical protein VF741_02555 [Candidatus Aquilonibacter sp.]